MYQVFEDVKRICAELEKIRINAQASEIIFRQRGEFETADRFKMLESRVAKSLTLLHDAI